VSHPFAGPSGTQRVGACLACVDLRDGAFDPLHGSADVQFDRVNADVSGSRDFIKSSAVTRLGMREADGRDGEAVRDPP
jgi:hypothetical protein